MDTLIIDGNCESVKVGFAVQKIDCTCESALKEITAYNALNADLTPFTQLERLFGCFNGFSFGQFQPPQYDIKLPASINLYNCFRNCVISGELSQLNISQFSSIENSFVRISGLTRVYGASKITSSFMEMSGAIDIDVEVMCETLNNDCEKDSDGKKEMGIFTPSGYSSDSLTGTVRYKFDRLPFVKISHSSNLTHILDGGYIGKLHIDGCNTNVIAETDIGSLRDANYGRTIIKRKIDCLEYCRRYDGSIKSTVIGVIDL